MDRPGRTTMGRLNDLSVVPLITLGQAVCRTLLLLREIGPPPPRDGGLLVVSNHISFVDPVVLQMTFRRRIRYLMTEDFYDVPAIRWFFRWMRALRVSETRTNLASLRVARDALRAGDLVGLFPEGGLSPDGRLQSARPGASVLASLAAVPVLPVRIRGTFDVWRRGLFPRPGRVTVTRGSPMPPPGSTRESRRSFTRDVMEAIAAL
jgi:1-acyl-sn-glycerol-3-phosphate acyltransferase